MYATNIRDRIRNEEKKAGKERSLHSLSDGINLFARKKKYPGITHDNSHVPGWNNKI